MTRFAKIMLIVVVISLTACGPNPDTTGRRSGMTYETNLTTTHGTDVADRVRKLVIEHLGVDESQVTENANFISDLGANKLDMVELVMAFEEEFGCEITDDIAKKLLRVGDVVNFIESHS
jgi:acyl carrier protein